MKIYPSILLVLVILFVNITLSQTIDWHAIANPAGFQTNSVQYSHNGQKVVSGTDCHPAKIRRFSSVTGSMDWDYTISPNLLCIMGVGIGSNGKYIAAIEEFGNLLIFDNTVSPPDSINTISIGTTFAFSLDFSPNNLKVAVGGNGGKLVICSIDSGSVLHSVNAHATSVTAVAYDPNNNFIVTGGSDNKVRIWDTTGIAIATLHGHNNDITKVIVSNDGSTIYSSANDKTIRIWDVATKTLTQTITNGNIAVNSIAISPDNKIIASVSSDSIIRFFKSPTWQERATIQEPTHGYGISIDWSSSLNQIAVGTKTGNIVTYSVQYVTSIKESNITNSFKLFPNPASDFLTIESNEELTFEISNSLGQIISSGITSNSNIDITSLQKGIYIITLINKQSDIKSLKFVKE